MKIQTKNNTPLRIENLVKWYGSLCAVNQVSFEIRPGEIFGLLGPNGAGKTSIISCITSVEEPTEGTAEVFGFNIAQEPKLAKFHFGCVPQELIHHGFFTLEEILHIHSGYYGIRNNTRQIEYLIEKLSLQEHRHKRIKELSGGTKRRLLIAKALVHQPKLLLLDEPTAGVDVDLRLKLWDFVKELKAQGTSILLTTHYLEEAEQLCDRVAFLDHGVLNVTGETSKLISEYTSKELTIHLKTALPFFDHPYLEYQTDGILRFRFPASHTVGEILAQLPVHISDLEDISIREGRLEDAFQKIVGNSHE